MCTFPSSIQQYNLIEEWRVVDSDLGANLIYKLEHYTILISVFSYVCNFNEALKQWPVSRLVAQTNCFCVEKFEIQ